MTRTNRCNRRAGFTLIELLVVIAIIAVLAAILFPVFASAKKAAARVSCVTQMKQIYQAAITYSDDRGGKLPPSTYNIFKFDGNATPPFNEMWLRMVEPYFKGAAGSTARAGGAQLWRIVRCPLCKLDPEKLYQADSGKDWWWNYALVSTMGYNYVYLSPYNSADGGTAVPQLVARALRPSKTIMIVDSQHDEAPMAYGYFEVDPPSRDAAIQDLGFTPVWHGGWGTQNAKYGRCSDRHDGSTNVVWLDGHISSTKIEALKDPNLWDLR